MESVSTCEDLPGIRNHLLLKDEEEEIDNQVRKPLLNVMDKAFAVTLQYRKGLVWLKILDIDMSFSLNCFIVLKIGFYFSERVENLFYATV